MGFILDEIAVETAILEASGPLAVWPENTTTNKRPIETVTPLVDLGYGSDLSCVDDVTESMSELDGSDITLVIQSNYRRLTTPRGSLPDDPYYGYDLAMLLNSGMTRVGIQGVADQIRAELEKDDRNDSIDVTLTQVTSREWKVSVTGETSEEPWEMTIAVVDGTSLLDSISTEGVA
jgi:hypothetical protein